MGMVNVVRGIVIGLLVLLGSSARSPARVWTDTWGRTYEGDLIRVSKEGARLKVKGVLRVIPFKNFSSADIAYLKGCDQNGHMKRVATREELESGAVVRLKGNFKSGKSQLQVNLGLKVKVTESDPACAEQPGVPSFSVHSDTVRDVMPFACPEKVIWTRSPLPASAVAQARAMRTSFAGALLDSIKQSLVAVVVAASVAVASAPS